ncbi:MAG: hypothetical protein PGN13_07885 [Patulibacter minatonensis]
MKIVNDIFSDLVEKKLWPIALLLIGAIALVPMWLSGPGEPPAPVAGPPAKVAEDAGPQLALTRTTKTGFDRAPRVNKRELDPFAERTTAKADAALKSLKAQISQSISNSLGGGTSDGGNLGGSTGGSSGGSTDVTPRPPSGGGGDTTSTTPKTEKDDLLTILVSSDADAASSEPQQINDIRTLSPLPDTENPFLVYLGKSSDGDAMFIVSADVTPSGAGKCDPSPTDCRTLSLAEGDSAKFKLASGATVTITIVGIETTKVEVTGEAARAARLELKARRVGAKVLKQSLSDPSILQSLYDHKVKFR